uniref:Uncharacterized protein n=1 Tax=Meloidogyne javanica TaxID=6303 RepID=A0A915NC51_MELJA
MPPKIKRTYSRCKKTTNEQFVQTEDDALLKLSNQLLNDLQKHGTETENDANKTNLLDNLTALNLDQNNAKKQLNEQINKVNLIFGAVNRDLLPWHGTIIKQQPQQPTPDPKSLYRPFW